MISLDESLFVHSPCALLLFEGTRLKIYLWMPGKGSASTIPCRRGQVLSRLAKVCHCAFLAAQFAPLFFPSLLSNSHTVRASNVSRGGEEVRHAETRFLVATGVPRWQAREPIEREMALPSFTKIQRRRCARVSIIAGQIVFENVYPS